MHLRAIKLRGFKSFPEAVEIRLEPGVAVVVGPNGSGKSNVADAIVWAAGSLSPSELRAEKADDVLFAGSGDRPAAAWCEVELLFDNEDGGLGVDFSEVSVTRRLHRGGEGQYLVNGAAVRRLDLVELLADAGLGAGMHSIVGQGKVEAVLASRPEERRALVEEAAGLGRFKQRRHRAELKLARVALDVDRARDLEAEVRTRLRPLALQASAAERAEKLGAELDAIRAHLAQLDVAALDGRLAELEGRRTASAIERRRIDGKLESLLGDRQQAEDELADAAGRREEATATLYRLRSASERAALRRESALELESRFRSELSECDDADSDRPALDRLEQAAHATAADARTAAASRVRAVEDARLARERLAALEHSLAEREGLPPAARALAEEGAQLVLSLLDVEPGAERAVAAALGPRAAALFAADPEAGYALLERARAAGLGSVRVVVGRQPAELVAELPVVPREELLGSTVPAVTQEGFGFDPARAELWFVGETAETVLLELESRRRALAAECDLLDGRASEAVAEAERLAAEASAAAAELARVPARRGPSAAAAALLPRLCAAAVALGATLAAAEGAAARLDPVLRARADAGAVRTGGLAERLRELGAAEADLRREAAEVGEKAATVEADRAVVEAELREARRRLDEANAEPVEDDGDREVLAAKLDRLERRREELGRVNPFAKEEYARERERLDELAMQREDLERSLTELEQLRAELTETVERRFAETFAAVQRNFAEVAGTLFPGGEGRLRLTESDEAAEPGVEVELRPAGKRVTRLSLLSGGEKALGAIAFLFALFLARPCPFYLLDEVEAALDDPNIGRFVALLREYSLRAQFIVVTHQKRTMEAADVLYGVTMGGDGVSQIVSRRLQQAGREAAVA